MGHIAGFVTHLGTFVTSGTIAVSGHAIAEDMVGDDVPITWGTSVSQDTPPSTINEAIKDAIIAAAVEAGYTVGPSDRKTLFGGGIAL